MASGLCAGVGEQVLSWVHTKTAKMSRWVRINALYGATHLAGSGYEVGPHQLAINRQSLVDDQLITCRSPPGQLCLIS